MIGRLRWIAAEWRALRGWLVVLVLLTVISTTVAVAYPLVLKGVLDHLQRVSAGSGLDAELSRLVGLLIAIALASLAANVYPPLRAYINMSIERQIRERYFGHILRKGEGFFRRFRTGDLVTRLTEDISEHLMLSWFCCSGIFRALESASKITFCVAVMMMLDWRLTLLAISPMPVMALIFVLVHRRLGRRVLEQRGAASATTSLLEASFAGVSIIKAFGAEDRQAAAVRRQLDSRVEIEMGLARLRQLVESLYESLSTVGQIVVIGAGGLLVLRGELSVGAFYAFYTYLGMLVEPLFDLPNLFVSGKQAFVCMDRIEEIRLAERALEGGAFHGSESAGPFRSLELERVLFAFAGQEAGSAPILDDVSLSIRRGERVAVVGQIGSGKTTLLRVAAGVLVPSSGSVQLDGRPLAAFAGFGPRVGVVGQEPMLLSASVRENVVFGRAAVDGRLEAVLEVVGMTSEVARLADGVRALVGPRGVTLSGGQRQRLAIARAIYDRPDLLLLDDLTSALDADNEERLWRWLATDLPEAAFLVVTHRATTARNMDRIIVLEGGRVVGAGSHDELLARVPSYRALVDGGE